MPADNPMSDAKVSLGRHLFYDTRLSGNGKQSCASCHEQSRAFAEGRARSVGSTGEVHPRGSMSLVNVAYARTLTWANPWLTRLEDQALVPMYGDHPIELGLDDADPWIQTIANDATYQALFKAAFDEREPFSRLNIVNAVAAFERSIVSARSPYDRYHFDRDEAAISEAAKRGEVLFHSRPLSCFTCHGGIHFSNAMGAPRRGTEPQLHNTGLYNLAGPLSYPKGNAGLSSHRQGRRCRQVQGADAAEYCRHRALHARRERRHARRGDRSLRRRRPDDRIGPERRRRARQPQQGRRRFAASR